MDRRSFIDFIGKGVVAVPLLQMGLSGCSRQKVGGIAPLSSDEIALTDGLQYEVLIRWGDPISKDQHFGYDNDYIAFLPTSSSEGLLWVNHESINPLFISGYVPDRKMARHRDQIKKEMYYVGGSLFKVKKSWGTWEVVQSPSNRRITGAIDIPFEWHEPIEGKDSAFGTLANCSGGVTPWGTILTCEENYQDFYGEHDYERGGYFPSRHQWESFFPNPTEHYGWVVEVDPANGACKKHVGLGRYAHECATVVSLPDGRVAIYSGDDREGGYLHKYISDQPGKIYPGKLYVANMEKGLWNHITYDDPLMAATFRSETEMLIRCREAAALLGGTPLDRPEDIDIDPVTGDVLVTLTNNKPKGNYFGSILRISESGGDYAALRFSYDTFLTGGEDTGFACPDNMVFDKAGNLWFTSDISGSAIGKPPYEAFGNNGLYVLLRNGEQAGKVIQVASAPNDAEFTGPCFTPDGRTLFLSVQHPGEQSKPSQLTSHWPDGGDEVPKPSVIAISGPFLEAVQEGA